MYCPLYADRRFAEVHCLDRRPSKRCGRRSDEPRARLGPSFTGSAVMKTALLQENRDVVGDTCMTSATTGRLVWHRHNSFRKPVDIFKEPAERDASRNTGIRSSMVWESSGSAGRSA